MKLLAAVFTAIALLASGAIVSATTGSTEESRSSGKSTKEPATTSECVEPGKHDTTATGQLGVVGYQSACGGTPQNDCDECERWMCGVVPCVFNARCCCEWDSSCGSDC